MEKKIPKVLVGCPVSDYHEYCTKEYLQAIKNLSYPNYEVLVIDNSKDDKFYNLIKDQIPTIRIDHSENVYERVINSRNLLRQKFLDGNYDFFLSLEQDVIPPQKVIERLLAHNKDIITGIYFLPKLKAGKTELVATAWVLHPEDKSKKVDLRKEIVMGKHLLKVDLCGLGCALIHRRVLEKIKFRHDLRYGDGIDDVFFCKDAREAGFEIYADTAIKCKHLILGRTWYWKDLIKEKQNL